MSAQVLDREEYIEQAYFFRAYRERVEDNMPSQDILGSIHEEVLSTTKLPMALEFLAGELTHTGRMSGGMARLSHYFTPFQTFVLSQAESDRSRFDFRIALQILEKEAEYRAEPPTRAGLFLFQFECIARNRLGYHDGIKAIAADPLFDEDWRDWIRRIRRELGAVDFADLIYHRSEYALFERQRASGNADLKAAVPLLFGTKEGRIAKANRGKDPLFLFAALQRQLGYPGVPRAEPKPDKPVIHPALEHRLHQLEQRIHLLEMETRGGGIDLSQFYVKPPEVDPDDDSTPHR